MSELEVPAEIAAPFDKSAAWTAIIQGFAANGELSPETLAKKGGDVRVRNLAIHAANLASNFHAEFVKANGANAT
jgi:hypothetical protein